MTLLVSLTSYMYALVSLHPNTSHIFTITTLSHLYHLTWEFKKPFDIKDEQNVTSFLGQNLGITLLKSPRVEIIMALFVLLTDPT